MASDVESSGEKIVPDVGIHHVRKILSASGSNRDVTPNTQDMTQGVLGCETAKNVPGADEQNAMHVDQQIKYTEAYGSGKENYGVVKFIPSTTRQSTSILERSNTPCQYITNMECAKRHQKRHEQASHRRHHFGARRKVGTTPQSRSFRNPINGGLNASGERI